ncbi:MAG: hypothetical protein WAW96_09260 [Alphaproteobacteria bacterium]
MSVPSKAKMRKPDNRLGEMMEEPGGVDRDDALSAAGGSLEALREESISGIEAAFKEIENVARSSLGADLSSEDLQSVLQLTDRIITLAGTYGFDLLGTVARSLGDLANLLMERPKRPAGAVLVHIHAAQLFSPKAEAPSADKARELLTELRKVIEHFDG